MLISYSIAKIQDERDKLEKELELEEESKVIITIPEILFFLNELKNGNADSLKYKRALISIFVNSIYLYDDKITIIFNSGNEQVTVDGELLTDIERKSQVNECSINLNEAPPFIFLVQYNVIFFLDSTNMKCYNCNIIYITVYFFK